MTPNAWLQLLVMVSLRECSCELSTHSLYSVGCTPKAITHRVQKFRDMATELGLRGGTAATTPTTGTKRGRKPKTDEDQNGDATEATPTKKAKQTPKTPKAKKVVAPKIENDGTDTEEAIKEEETAEEGSENTV